MKKVLSVLILMAVMFMGVSVSEAVQASVVTTLAKEMMGQGAFKIADTYKIAFYTSSRTCDATETIYSATNEVSGTNYSAGGFSLSGQVWATSGTTAFLDFTDLSQNTITFTSASTCALVYDDTLSNASCTANGAPWACCTGNGQGANCVKTVLFTLTFSSIQPSAGTLTVTWPAADASNAILRIQ